MRIALVTDTYTPQVNGVTTVVQGMVHALRGLGHEVFVVAPRYDGDQRREPQELRIGSVPCPFYTDIRLSAPRVGHVAGQLARFDPDVVHVATEGPLGFAGRRFALTEGTALVTSFHTDFPRYCRDYGVSSLEPIVWRWLKWFHLPARITHTPGRAMCDTLRSVGIAHAVVWGQGVDAQTLHPGRRNASWRRRFGVSDSTIIVLHVGRLAREKSVDVLLATWTKAREAVGHRAEFVIAGDGPLASTVSREAPWIRRLGFLGREELADLYANADICVLPSRTETCGLVALEAMASGLPVIAADAGGFRESVDNGRNGFLIAPTDISGFTSAIVRLVMESQLRRNLAEGARTTAEGRDQAREYDALIAQYTAILNPMDGALACSIA